MSGSYSRRKGQRAEQDVARYLRSEKWDAQTSRAASGAQRGDDLVTDCPLSFEIKDHARVELAAWVDQAVSNSSPGRPGVVVHKRRGKGNPADWYATMRLGDLIWLMRKLR